MAAPSKRISPCDSRVKILGSLTNRIFLASAALAVLSIGAAGVLRQPHDDAARPKPNCSAGCIEAGTLVDQQCATLVQTLTVMARLVADDPRLKAAVDTGDPPTVQPLAREYQEQLNAALLVLTSRHRRVLAEVGDLDVAEGAIGDAAGDSAARSRVASRAASGPRPTASCRW